jgi:hypothetical protein
MPAAAVEPVAQLGPFAGKLGDSPKPANKNVWRANFIAL